MTAGSTRLGVDRSGVDPPGVIFALLAYCMWGFIPIYFKQLSHFTPWGILAGRITSSVILLILLFPLLKKTRDVFSLFSNVRVLGLLLTSALLLSGNWLIFIYGVLQNEIRQCSLGYFINPLLTVLLGALVFQERLRPYHYASMVLATLGILVDAVRLQGIPWIALGLAITFAGYAVVRRISPVDSVGGLLVEVCLLLPFALLYLACGPLAQGEVELRDWMFLAGSGLVTALPLICYVSAVRRITFITVGFLQYLAPTLQLWVGVRLYGEPFPRERLLSYGFIWLSVLVFLVGTTWSAWSARRVRSATPLLPD